MNSMSSKLACTCAALVLSAACNFASAAEPDEVVVQSSTFGLLTLPFSNGFSLSVAPLAQPFGSDDYFLSDYGFSIGSSASLNSAVVTFDLTSIFQIADFSVTLLKGEPWSGSVPGALSPTEIAARDSNIIVASNGMGNTQMIDSLALGMGDYVLEIRGRATGTSGGSYGGLVNVAAVPEPAGAALALAGLGFLGLFAARRKR
jgi:hypothetical protein